MCTVDWAVHPINSVDLPDTQALLVTQLAERTSLPQSFHIFKSLRLESFA